MGQNGVQVNKLYNGLNRKSTSEDGVVLLVVGGAVAASGLAVGIAQELLSLEDAVALGITASYDDTNSILAHHHVDEFFRINPNGNLFVILDDGSLNIAGLQAILRANSEIKAVGFAANNTAVIADFAAYVSNYQTMVDELRSESRLISAVFVGGNVFDSTTLIVNYPDVRELNAANVSVVIGQDPIIAAVKPAYANYAAIGAALGAFSVRNVNENLGSVDVENKPNAYKGNTNYTLTDTDRSRFLTASLQNGVDSNSLSVAEMTSLAAKGYVFVTSYNGYDGFYFSDSHTCVSTTSDYSRVENNRVWDKAAGLVSIALLPRIKSNLQKDPTTGFIREIEAKELEQLAENALQSMESAGEISGLSVYIDVEQDLSNDAPLSIQSSVVFNNIVHTIEFDLGLTNKLQ